jgi:6-pyruvoyltetrahydropterin/6-carboxytetrahydropterin synthase
VTPPSFADAPENGRLTAVRRIQFCAGHRVQQHESKCRNLHGHNYVAFFHAVSDSGLDALGRVIDFGVMKERLGAFIEEHWDHGFILAREDREAIEAVQRVQGQKLSLLSVNPTAENMAQHLLSEVCPRALEGSGVRIVKVVLWETENCFVEARAHVRR